MEKWTQKWHKNSNTRMIWIKRLRIAYGVLWNTALIALILFTAAAVFAGSAGAGYFASLVKNEEVLSYDDMKKDIHNYEETTEVYFANQELAGKLRTDLSRTKVKLEQISPHLVKAIVATEDEFFYQHNGVVPKAIFRALYQEFTNSSMQSGGSTLTQQLIKNQILTNEVSFDRKAKEILLALRLERFFKKDEILESYLNMAHFGRDNAGKNIAGAETAAQGIFGISAKDLSIAQAAFIAGLPQSPFAYTPYTNEGTLKKDLTPGISRMKIVLRRMLSEQVISMAEYESASSEDIAKQFKKPNKSSMNNKYPFLTDEIEKRAKLILMDYLADKDGYLPADLTRDRKLRDDYLALADRQLRQNGYRIYTTIDKDIYEAMQQAAKNYQDYGQIHPVQKKNPDTGKTETVQEPIELGAVLIENKSGKILSFVGGRDHERKQVNHATSTLRSIGSTMKPLLFYAPGMEEGFLQPGSYLADLPYEKIMNGKPYAPKNSGGVFHGLVSARTALAHSYNVPVVRGYEKLMSSKPLRYLYKMGITSIPEENNNFLALPLGGGGNVTVEENVNAYATFANGGKFIDGYLIESIEGTDGTVIYQHETAAEDVFSPQTAYLTIDMLRDVLSEGTGKRVPSLLQFNSDWAGKTGTTQDTHDSWFVASNPNITFGTWIGYDTPSSILTYHGKPYSRRNQEVWSSLINAAYAKKPDLIGPETPFKMPEGVAEFSYCTLSGSLPSDLCRQAGLVKSDLFNVKYAPETVDDSLKYGKYILQDGAAYEVPDSAPQDFVYEGPIINKELLDRFGLESPEDLYKYTKNLGRLVVYSGKRAGINGLRPSQLTGVSIDGSTLKWNESGSSDVLGYRVYMSSRGTGSYTKIASISASDGTGLTVSALPASYYVTAVDAEGKESPPSPVASTAKRPAAKKKASNYKNRNERIKNDGEPRAATGQDGEASGTIIQQ
ncbi:transglycosylase domain-containing protein [Bacillus sp. FJAT-42376]|uniref:transglycosylase domain-containing protein n=1 Tax=Bacillus sp. FJAT-42376 TaxID=2014076 RepID=UPI0013DDCF71|nr:transglycosylase domain-containing protein [Bacillus sp. FJAT-42376]